MFAIEIRERIAIFLFIRKQYLTIFGYFPKSASGVHVTILKHCSGLDSLQGPQLITNTKKITHPCFVGNNVWVQKCIFSKFEEIRFFSVFESVPFKHFDSVPFKTMRKSLKKSIFLIKA